MRGHQCSADLLGYRQTLDRSKCGAAGEVTGQRFTIHEFHGEKCDHATRFRIMMAVQIENAADVRMRYRTGELNLALKVGESIGALPPHGLDGDSRAEFEILGFIYFAHTAGADGPQDAIATG